MKGIKSVMALLAAGMLAITGCADKEERPEEPIVINVYDSASDYQGIQGGWYGEILEEEFNIRLNFLDNSKESSLLSADLYVCDSDDVSPQEMLEKGLLLNMEEYFEGGLFSDWEIIDYKGSYEHWNESLSQEGIYVLPTEVSRLSQISPSEENIPGYGIYLNWEAYGKIGMPDIKDKEELLDVLQQMKKQAGGDGEDYRGLILYRDEETDLLDQVSFLMGAYGGEREGFLIYKNGRYDELLEKESLYEEMLLWLREAYQRELVTEDPKISKKQTLSCYQEGKALLSIWPQLAAQGYELAPVEDMEVVSYGCDPLGNLDVYVGIGAGVKEPERIMEFVSWLYSKEGIMLSCTDTGLKAAGPQGLTWDVESGNPVLTDFGKQAFASQLKKDTVSSEGLQVPEEWGGGTWQEGSCQLSLQPVTNVEVSPSGFSYNYTLWDTTMEQYTDTPLSWQERMDASEPMEYLIVNDRISVLPAYVKPLRSEPEDIAGQRKACRKVIEEYSSKIIRAATEDDCETLFDEMRDKAVLAGYDNVVEYDRENAYYQEEFPF